MSASTVAERYAQAIFELGVESGELSALATGLGDFAEAFESNEELKSTLLNPLLPREKLGELISTVGKRLGLSELGIRALRVMSNRGRLSALRETVEHLTQLHDEKEGILRAHVTTAVEMPEAYYKEFSERLERATQRRVVLVRSVDPALVAGAVARVGGAVLDASVQGRLSKFEHDVLKAIAAGAA